MDFEKFLKDYGPDQVELPIEKLAMLNNNYRKAIWTGNNLQITLMSLKPNEDIGLEMHGSIDQLLFVVKGRAGVYSGKTEGEVGFKNFVDSGDLITLPAGTWHNVVNKGFSNLKLISVYAPVKHPFGVEQKTKEDQEE